jgi:DNA polymerase
MRTFRRTNMLLSRFYTVRSRVRKADGCFPYALKYFGAVPGRWSGDAGFNVQNMPRGELFGADLRKCFVPKSGPEVSRKCFWDSPKETTQRGEANVFIIADLCQIEPRILAWLIEDEAFLSLVRSGVDIYEAHARSTMGYSDSRPLKESDPDKRALAKARVLGLGYGCGPQKFVTVAKNLGGIDITFADAKKTVADFRSKNPRISRLWNQLDRDFKRSAGGDYSIELPSGRVLRYFNVAKMPRGYYAAATERGGKLRSLYGCLLTENLVQATARDLFAEHLLQIHRAGIGRIVFHVHDEVIVEVPREQAEEAEQRILEIMRTTPDWLSGCPVAAESKILNRYTK